ncbi:MAG: hypothetical protein Q8M73_07945 [Actinomycetota bacterium]|nr:hypothetical protein [Actinomycetota bacterium]
MSAIVRFAAAGALAFGAAVSAAASPAASEPAQDLQVKTVQAAHPTASNRDGSGMRTPLRSVQSAIANSLRTRTRPNCHTVVLARSNANWGLISSSRYATSNQDVCEPYEGVTLIRKTSTGWVRTGFTGSSFGCSDLSSSSNGWLSREGAPRPVIQDLQRFLSCDSLA